MRLWTLHPKYLDPQGLLAVWRESLLAQRVLGGGTRGYRRHPQLERFREEPDPLVAIGEYLRGIHQESLRRGYRFDDGRIVADPAPLLSLQEAEGQVRFEWRHLLSKLASRSPHLFEAYREVEVPEVHPLFRIVAGPIARWERGSD